MIRALPASLGWLAFLASLCRSFRFLICAIGTKTVPSGLRLPVSLPGQLPPLFCPGGSDLVWLFPSFWAFYPLALDSFCQQIKPLLSGLLRLWLSLLVGLLLLLAILQLTVLSPVVFFRLVQTASKIVLCSVVFLSPILTCYYSFFSPPHK